MKIPNGLPINRPVAIPIGSSDVSPERETPCKETPHWQKQTMAKLNRQPTDVNHAPAIQKESVGLGMQRIIKPTITPAKVACTPDLRIQTHKTKPTSR